MARPEHNPPPEAEPLSVLLVEDDEVARRLVRRSMLSTEARIVVEEAVNVAEALAALRRKDYDCALVDFRLPDGDGFDLLAALQAQGGSKTPIVILTALADEGTALQLIQSGAQDFLTKGKLDGNLLLRSIRYAIERKRAAEMRLQLVQMDRMAALGTLSAGVAHEINNPLAYIVTNIAYLTDELPRLVAAIPADGPHAAESVARAKELAVVLEETRHGADRVRDIVRDLHSFTRASNDERRVPMQISTVLERAIQMASNDLRHRARIVRDFSEVPPVFANQARLGQVFLNLLLNAAQALPEGHAEENAVHIATGLDPTGRVVITIRDTGAGIPPERLGRIFDPFFTTRPVGGGSGLGLFICDGIVRAMGGQITVESQVGKGTSFRVSLLPAGDDWTLDGSETPPRLAETKRGRILVIDDEPLELASLRRLLQGEHEVTTTSSALEALTRLRAGESFDLVLTDLMMPEMTGMELLGEIARLTPELARQTVFVTGGAFTPSAQQFLLAIPNRRIEKPFEPAALRGLVRELLQA